MPVTVDGQHVRLEMRVYKPAAAGPAPTLVFNHGSTGSGMDPRRFRRPIDFPALAQFFVQRGWAVVMPARRGRGGSEGEYDEGFETIRARGYTCDPSRAIPGADRALRDIEAAMVAILAMPFVDRDRVVIGGQSRGGILSVAYGGLHGEQVRGETLWLYGEGDPFYGLTHSRRNFTAFQSAGGTGVFHEFEPPPGIDGHSIVARPELWATVVEAYLKRRGLPVGD